MKGHPSQGLYISRTTQKTVVGGGGQVWPALVSNSISVCLSVL
jgi:hypothetical protein